MPAFPLVAENGKILLRIPKNMRIVVRNWYVNGTSGTPYRVDGWTIREHNGKLQAEFLFNEPESYL
jgi:hypothetical protein